MCYWEHWVINQFEPKALLIHTANGSEEIVYFLATDPAWLSLIKSAGWRWMMLGITSELQMYHNDRN